MFHNRENNFFCHFRMSDILSGSGVATNDPKNIHDMTAFIQQSLTDMQGKFTNMSDQVYFYWLS